MTFNPEAFLDGMYPAGEAPFNANIIADAESPEKVVISEDAMESMNAAIRHLQAMPEKPTEE